MSQSPYAQSWRELAPDGPRSAFRGAAISTLARVLNASGRMSALLRRPRVQVVLLHHVFSDEEEPFRQLLRELQRGHAFISYSDAVRRAETGGAEIDRPYLAFTFDDGFLNTLRAAQIMQEFEAKGCVFVCPSIVGETDLDIIKSFCRDRLELPRRPVQFMNWDDLHTLLDAGHEVGGHTMTHANLAKVSFAEAVDEVGGSFEVLQRRLGEARHFAWTYGRFSDITPEVIRKVFETGYVSCASGERGCHRPQRVPTSAPFCVRRDHLVAGWPLIHATYFLARSAARDSQ